MDFESAMKYAVGKGGSAEDLGALARALDDDDVGQTAKILSKIDAEAERLAAAPTPVAPPPQPEIPPAPLPPNLAQAKAAWELAGRPQSGEVHKAMRTALDSQWKWVEDEIAEVRHQQRVGISMAETPAALQAAGEVMDMATVAVKDVRSKFRAGQATEVELQTAARNLAAAHDNFVKLKFGGR